MKGIKKILVSLVTVAMLLCVGTVNVLAQDYTRLTLYLGENDSFQEKVVMEKEGPEVTFSLDDVLTGLSPIEKVGDKYFKTYGGVRYELYLLGNLFPQDLKAENNDEWQNERTITLVPATKKVNIVYLTENGIKLDSEEIEVASDAVEFELTALTKVTDGVFEKDGVKYTTEYNGYIIDNEDGTYTGIVNVKKIPTTKKVNIVYLTENGIKLDSEEIEVASDAVEFELTALTKVTDGVFEKDGVKYTTEYNGYIIDNEDGTYTGIVNVKKIPTTKKVNIVYLTENGIKLDSEEIEVASDAVEFELTALTKVTDGVFEKDGVKYTTEYNGYIIDNEDGTYTGIVNVKKIPTTKKVNIVYLTENGIKLDSEEIEVASDAETFESTLLTKVTDGVFEKDGVKYTTEYNGYIFEKDGIDTGIVNVIKINNEVETTLFVNLMYGDQYVGQVILHKTSEKNNPVTFKYEDYRDQLEVVANGVRYYVPETMIGDFAWTLKEGGEAEANVDVTADEKELTLQVDFVYNGSNPIATVYLHKTVLLGESYKFTMADLEKVEGLVKKEQGLVFVSNNLECLNGAIEFTIPEDFLSGDWAEVSSLETEPHVYTSDVIPATEAETKLVVEFKCNGVTVGDTVELVKENLIKTTTYTFTTEDLAGELPGLTFKVGDDVYEVIDADPLSGEWATVTAGDSHTYSVDVLKLAKPAKPSTGGSSSSSTTTNTTTKAVVNTSAK